MTPGALIGKKYRLTRPIGEGAMGVVWAAVNEDTSGEVALKLILRSTEELRARLKREAHAAGKLRHPNVIEIYDRGETVEGDPFLVMPLLTGETLSELLGRQRRLDPPVAARIARDVARALGAAHAGQVIHRDLKPANIFLHQEPHADAPIVKVLDFGVSKNLEATDGLHTVAGGAVGSPAYMSPEQARADRNIDHRSDIWSLGVVLFEMLTGVRPFKGDASQLIAQIVTGEIPLVSRFVRVIDPGLVALVARCLERDRDKRIGTAMELAAMLDRFVTPGAVPSPTPSQPGLQARPVSVSELANLESTAPLSDAGSSHNAPSAASTPRAPLGSRPDWVDPATRSPRIDGSASVAAMSMAEDELDLAQTTKMGKDAMLAMMAPRAASAAQTPLPAAPLSPTPPRPPAPSVPRHDSVTPSHPAYPAPAPRSSPGGGEPVPRSGSGPSFNAPAQGATPLDTTAPLPAPWSAAAPQAGPAMMPPGANESASWPVLRQGTMPMIPSAERLMQGPQFGPPSQSSSTSAMLKMPTGSSGLNSEAATLEAITSKRKLKTAVVIGLGLGAVGLIVALLLSPGSTTETTNATADAAVPTPSPTPTPATPAAEPSATATVTAQPSVKPAETAVKSTPPLPSTQKPQASTLPTAQPLRPSGASTATPRAAGGASTSGTQKPQSSGGKGNDGGPSFLDKLKRNASKP